jgi:hypothetical protein
MISASDFGESREARMTVFLSGSDIRNRIIELVADSNKMDCAVAFWGRGASELFASRSPKLRIRIICDLMSGACNPIVIRDLLSIGVQIKLVDGMHAKVYWTPSGVIVGSANASANGLGEEGADETYDKTEVDLYTDDPTVLKDTSDWFDKQWIAGTPVDEPLLQRADELWMRRRANRPVRSGNSSLLGLLRDNPEWFRERPMRLVVYKGEDISEEARVKWEEEKHRLYDAKSLRRYEDELPLYEDRTRWNIPKGEYVLDYSLTFRGLWRVRQENAFVRIGRNHRLILLDKLNTPPFGLHFPRQEQIELGKQIKRVLDERGRTLDKHGNYLDLRLDEAGHLLFPT